MTEDDASDYAYLYAEAVVYDTFLRVLHMSGADEATIDEYINLFNFVVWKLCFVDYGCR